MALPPLPQKLGDPQRDIDSLFLYLQRIRDGFTENVVTEVIASNYSDENAQDAVGTILRDTSTVHPHYDDSIPQITFDIPSNSSTQKIEIAKDGNTIGIRKRINFLSKSHNQLILNSDSVEDEVEISSIPFLSRLNSSGETLTIPDTFAIVVPSYYKVQGVVQIQGDGVIKIL
jgi:hypothetical protein